MENDTIDIMCYSLDTCACNEFDTVALIGANISKPGSMNSFCLLVCSLQ